MVKTSQMRESLKKDDVMKDENLAWALAETALSARFKVVLDLEMIWFLNCNILISCNVLILTSLQLYRPFLGLTLFDFTMNRLCEKRRPTGKAKSPHPPSQDIHRSVENHNPPERLRSFVNYGKHSLGVIQFRGIFDSMIKLINYWSS